MAVRTWWYGGCQNGDYILHPNRTPISTSLALKMVIIHPSDFVSHATEYDLVGFLTSQVLF